MSKAWVEIKERRETLCINIDDLLEEMPKEELHRFATRVAFADSIVLALARTLVNFPHGDIPIEQVASLDAGDDMAQYWYGTETVNKARQIVAPLAGPVVAAEIERLRMVEEEAKQLRCSVFMFIHEACKDKEPEEISSAMQYWREKIEAESTELSRLSRITGEEAKGTGDAATTD